MFRFAVLSVLLAVWAPDVSAKQPEERERPFRIHFRNLHPAPNQQIREIDLSVACGHISNVDGIPGDWNIRVIRAVSGVEKFVATAGHGASNLDSLEPFDGAVAVLKEEAGCFNVSGFILIEDDEDRKIPISSSNIRLQRN